jgi:hypothetical protein
MISARTGSSSLASVTPHHTPVATSCARGLTDNYRYRQDHIKLNIFDGQYRRRIRRPVVVVL